MILKTNHSNIMDDPFIREHIEGTCFVFWGTLVSLGEYRGGDSGLPLGYSYVKGDIKHPCMWYQACFRDRNDPFPPAELRERYCDG